MRSWVVHYQFKVAAGSYYPFQIEVLANNRLGARRNAMRIINENTDFEAVEKVIITKIEPV
jgi:hypothetical protein